MDVKTRHKLIEIEDRVSDRFVILVTNYRWLRILEVIRYRRSNRPILKNTRQINKIHSFINERDFDKMSFGFNVLLLLRCQVQYNNHKRQTEVSEKDVGM